MLGAPWVDELQVDPLRVLVNRLRVIADREGWAHLHAVANELVVRLNFYDSEHSTPE